ncbi:MAG: hypothetical protein IJI34_10765 [Clostridia bacterium]|nr:hypothetical protein [Clostridia bacterium]
MHRKPFLLPLCAALLALVLLFGCTPDPVQQPEADASSMPSEPPAPAPAPTPVPTPEPILLNGKTFSGDETELSLVLTAAEMPVLERFPNLAVLDLSGSECYDAIEAYRAAHPDVDVRFTVPVEGRDVPHDTEELSISAPVDPALLSHLHALRHLSVTEPLSPADAEALLAVLPAEALTYSVSFCGLTVPSDADSLDLSEVSPEQLDEILPALPVLPSLSRIRLDPESGASRWTLEQAGEIERVRADVLVDLTVTVFDTTFNLTDESVTFLKIDLSDRLDEVRNVLSCAPHVGRMVFDQCKIPDEQLAELRSEFSSPKVVWRIFMKYYSCLTDVIMIRFSDNDELRKLYDKDTAPLVYCNEVRYLDLGHDHITDAYFVANMPDLEVLILAVGDGTDVSALKNCPKLEYCEIFSCHVADISALANCTELEHLNICRTEITDITPLYGLKKLKRLWLSRSPIPTEQIEEIQRLLPDCIVDTTAYDPTGEGWRYYGYYIDNYTPRYRLLREQMCYDRLWIRSYSEYDRAHW